jgi:hypothetical protein
MKVLFISHNNVATNDHHQPINVPTAGAQAILMGCSQGERATHHASPTATYIKI